MITVCPNIWEKVVLTFKKYMRKTGLMSKEQMENATKLYCFKTMVVHV